MLTCESVNIIWKIVSRVKIECIHFLNNFFIIQLFIKTKNFTVIMFCKAFDWQKMHEEATLTCMRADHSLNWGAVHVFNCRHRLPAIFYPLIGEKEDETITCPGAAWPGEEIEVYWTPITPLKPCIWPCSLSTKRNVCDWKCRVNNIISLLAFLFLIELSHLWVKCQRRHLDCFVKK